MTSIFTSIFANIHRSLCCISLAENELKLYFQESILIKNNVFNIDQFQVLNW